MKIGIPIALQQDLLTSRTLVPFQVSGESAAIQAGANEVMRTTVESQQGRLHIQATIVDAATQKNLSVNSADAASAADLITALNTLAKRIDGRAVEFSTRNPKALEALAQAAAAANAQTRVQFLSRAAIIDPACGFAYLVLLDILGPTGQQNVAPVLKEAQERRKQFTPYIQAKFDFTAARLQHAPPAELTKAAQAVLAMAPNDSDVLAALGAIRFQAGDASGGGKYLRQASLVNPVSPNLRNQLAMGLFQAKRFSEAEKILTQLDKAPAVLPELATCLLLEGDVTRANAAAERFFASVSNEQLRQLIRATWLAATGDRAKAIDSIENTKFTDSEIKAVALGEATIWRLLDKDYAGAKKSAAEVAADNRSGSFANLTRLLAASNQEAGAWKREADGSPALSPQAKEPLLAYGLFLGGHYAEAAQEWRKITDRQRGQDPRANTMLAASLRKAGQGSEAGKIAVQPFVIEFGDLYGVVSFGEMRRQLAPIK